MNARARTISVVDRRVVSLSFASTVLTGSLLGLAYVGIDLHAAEALIGAAILGAALSAVVATVAFSQLQRAVPVIGSCVVGFLTIFIPPIIVDREVGDPCDETASDPTCARLPGETMDGLCQALPPDCATSDGTGRCLGARQCPTYRKRKALSRRLRFEADR